MGLMIALVVETVGTVLSGNMSDSKARLKLTEQRGIHITFENGLSLSVQFGIGNYCDNRSMDFSKMDGPVNATSTVEIAVWNEEGDWLLENQVAGYVPVQAIPVLMSLVRDGLVEELNQMCDDQVWAY